VLPSRPPQTYFAALRPAPGDLAGTYTGVGGGAAVAAGVSGVRLRNEKGVVLELRGAKLGVEVSANLALVTITMK
jgi:hypothetical protein